MPYIKVNTNKIKNYSSTINSFRSKIRSIGDEFDYLAENLDWDIQSASNIRKRTNTINSDLNTISSSLNKMEMFLLEAIQRYDGTNDTKPSNDKGINVGDALVASVISAPPPSTIKPVGENTGNNNSSESNNGGDWLGYEVTDREVSAYIGKVHASHKGDIAYGEVDAYLGRAKAGWDFGFKFMDHNLEYTKQNKDSEWDEQADLEIISIDAKVGASVSVLEAEARGGLGNNALGVDGEISGSVGSAKAEGKFDFGITADDGKFTVDLNVNGKAMVSAAEGEAKFSFNFLGLDLGFSIGGYAGALGVEGKFGLDNGKFAMRGGAAALLGISLGLELGFNSDGFYDAVEWAEETWDDVTDWAEETWDDVTDWAEETWDDVTDWAEETWDDVTDWTEETWDDVTDWAEETWDDVTDWAEETWDDVTDWAEETWEDVTDIATDFWETTTEVASNVVDTVSNTISDAWEATTNFVGKIFSGW